MNINIPDQIISEFLLGVIAVLAVIVMGVFLSFVLRRIARKLPFTYIGLVLALSPLSLINFLGISERIALLIYSMLATLLGVSIDGVSHLLIPKEQSQSGQNPVKQEEETIEPNPCLMVWGKAVKICVLLMTMFLIIMTVLFVSTFWVLVENTQMIGGRVNELIETNEQRLGEISGKVQHSAPISNLMMGNSYSLQHTFADGVPFLPEATGTTCIDFEFPLESYQRMTDATLGDADRKAAEQQFLQDVKKPTKTFWVLIEKTHMTGQYHKARSMEILESMEAEGFHDAIEDLKEFIKNN